MDTKNKDILKYSLYFTLIVFIITILIRIALMRSSTFGAKLLIDNISMPIALGCGFAIIYEKYIWKLCFWKHYLVLNNNYSGTLTSTFDNKQRSINIQVKQTLTSCCLHLKTNESESDSISAEILNIRGRQVLVYTYFNTSDAMYREKSPIHYGTAFLYVKDNKSLDGNYFTDRKTTGSIKIKSID